MFAATPINVFYMSWLWKMDPIKCLFLPTMVVLIFQLRHPDLFLGRDLIKYWSDQIFFFFSVETWSNVDQQYPAKKLRKYYFMDTRCNTCFCCQGVSVVVRDEANPFSISISLTPSLYFPYPSSLRHQVTTQSYGEMSSPPLNPIQLERSWC